MLHGLRCLAIVTLSLLAWLVPAAGQSYPDRVIRIVNPYPPGGSVDITARLLAQKLAENLGHQVIVENRTGAGGNTGADSVAKSDPDGYTLLFAAPGPLVVNQTLYTKGLPFDPVRDFAPIAVFAFTPIVLMANPGIPATNVQELIAFARSNPGKVHFGSAGMGSTPHLSGELFKSMTGTQIVHVPYRGTGPAMNDLIGGHIQMFFDLLPGSLPQISAGKVRALANAGAKRTSALPESSDRRGAGPAGNRRRVLGRPGGSGEDAGAGSRQAAQRGRQGDQVHRRRRSAQPDGLRARHRIRAAGSCFPRRRDEEMGRGDPGVGCEGGLKSEGPGQRGSFRKLRLLDQRMGRRCGVSFRQLRTSRHMCQRQLWPSELMRCSKIPSYSITSSARKRREWGSVMPICFAVRALSISSNLVGCSMGKSLGLEPLRILST